MESTECPYTHGFYTQIALLTINISHHIGIFVTINKPKLTHYYHPKSIADITVHSWCSLSEFLQMYTDMYQEL